MNRRLAVKSTRQLRLDAARIWTAALDAANPEMAVRKHVKRRGNELRVNHWVYDLGKFKRVWVLGAGKAAAPMGRALEKILGHHLTGGILVTKYRHGLPLKITELLEAGHPLPDANGVAAGVGIRNLAEKEVGPADLVFCLLSGGGSALLVAPAAGITLEDKLACTQLLMNAGANIHELNAVRKHLSDLKGGGLARSLGGVAIISLILSDVVGNELHTIASGPLVPDPTTFRDCQAIVRRLRVTGQIPPSIRRRIEAGVAGKIPETPKPGDPIFRTTHNVVVGSNAQACASAVRQARRLGYRSMVLTSRLEGDNREAARLHMSIAQEIIFEGRPLRRPACLVSGGETTVEVTGGGTGGRNQEFVLHCARPLGHLPSPCVVASLGTDGTDGPTEAAGAVADNSTLSRSLKFGAHFLTESLINNDSYHFFKRLNDLIQTGPTRTNVMDLHILLLG
jgi:glycerate 2-kinase